MRRLIALTCFGLLASCASNAGNNYTQTVQSWRGGNMKTLTSRWGSPSDQATGAGGNTAYFYNTNSYQAAGAATPPAVGVHFENRGTPVITSGGTAVMNASDRGGMSLNCTAIFVANAKGQIVDTQIQGVGCYGGTNFAARMGNPNHPVATTAPGH